MKKTLLVIISAMLTGILLGALCFGAVRWIHGSDLPEDGTSQTVPDSSSESVNGCYVAELFAYSGRDPETADGELLDGVAAVKIVNNSSIDLRYAEIRVRTETDEYVFLASSWMAGSKMTVTEVNGTVLPSDAVFVGAEITSMDSFGNTVSLHEEELALDFDGRTLIAENVSGGALSGRTVYVKACDDYGYLGGITYKVSVPELEAGEEIRIDTEIGAGGGLKAVFVTAAGEE